MKIFDSSDSINSFIGADCIDILQYDSEKLGCNFPKAKQLVMDVVSQESQYFTAFSCALHYQSGLIKCDMIWTQLSSGGLHFILEGIEA